jgi:Uma2 family endonuclease
MSTAPPVIAPPATVAAPSAGAVPTAPPIVIDGRLRIPAGIGDQEAFRRWARSEERPERVRFAWLAGTLWVDPTREQAYAHNDVKTEVATVLRPFVKATGQGRYFGDGMLLSNTTADLSTVPDGAFVSFVAFQTGRVREVPGRVAGVVEFEGSPDMVLEVVSESSVEKDTVRLPELYRRAEIREFWRIDARGELRFEILRLTDAGYVPCQEADGWWRSEVFGRSFQMTRQADSLGRPLCTLSIRE